MRRLHAVLLAVAVAGASASTAGACDSTRARWPNRAADPLRVWIQPPTGGLGGMDDREQVRGAFAEWNGVGLPFRFRFTADSQSADIRVRWTSSFPDRMSGNTLCTITRDNWILAAELVLASRHPDGRWLARDEMHVLALHEIGHALGLPHAAAGIMAPVARVRGLAESDVDAARRLYGSTPPSRRPPS